MFVLIEWANFAVAVNGSMLLSIKEKLLTSNYYPNITFDAQKILNMLHSTNYQETEITIGGNQFRMEYDLSNVIPGSFRAFGNIYVNPEEPIEFTFFTINNKIGGYTPMNGTKEFIGSIVHAVLGQHLPYEDF